MPISVQWFSVPAGRTTADFWSAVHTDEFRVLEAHANARKLRRGALLGNKFRIRLRKVSWPREALEEKLTALRTQGAPNYFGPQRFGRDGFNLDRVAEWLQTGQRPGGPRRARVCALRGALFDLQCGARAPGAERRLVAARRG